MLMKVFARGRFGSGIDAPPGLTCPIKTQLFGNLYEN
jgi:hypothetical protein